MTSEAYLPLRETCRVVGGTVPLWRHHIERLRAGGLPEATLDAAEQAVFEQAARFADARPTQRFRLELVVSFTGEISVAVSRRLSSLDVPNGPRVARVDVAGTPPLPPGPAKPVDRSWWDEAHCTARSSRSHQAIIVGSDGCVVDGSTATVWIAEAGVLITPPSPPAIPGVGRAFVLANADRAELPVRVESLSWERFVSAEEAFLTNAFGGAAPVRGRGGDAFDRVAMLFAREWAEPPARHPQSAAS